MSEQNKYNLSLFLQAQHLPVDKDAEMIVEEQQWRDRYKVSMGQHGYHVSKQYLPKFWLSLENAEWGDVLAIEDTHDGRIEYLPIVTPEFAATVTLDESDPLFETEGLHYTAIDKRISGLINATKEVIPQIARTLNRRMDEVARDTSIVKDFDGIMTFVSDLGLDFKLMLGFDKVPPVNESGERIVVQRTPMTQEDFDYYLGLDAPRIQSRIDHINKLVTDVVNSRDIKWNPECADYAAKAINITILKAFLDQSITFITFGGVDDWRLLGKETPNNKVCYEILDEQINHIISELDALEKPEGVDIFSLDMETYSVFGRNFDNKVITPAIKDISDKILSRYSQGFERVLTTRMGLTDNAHFFKA